MPPALLVRSAASASRPVEARGADTRRTAKPSQEVATTATNRSAWPHNRQTRGPVTRVRFAATIAVLGMVVTGCGGSSSSGHPFARTANAICAHTSQSLAMVPAIGGTLAKLALDVTDQLPIYEKELNQLSVLEAPASTESTYANALSSARTDVRLLHQLYRAARAGNETKVHEIALEGSSAYSVAGTAMRRIGLTRCANSL